MLTEPPENHWTSVPHLFQTRRVSGRLVLLCGKSFSGKSTLARALADALPAVIVSLDAINDERKLQSGAGIPLEEWARTHDIAHGRVGEALRNGSIVIVDDTSSPRFLREAWRELGAILDAPVVLVFIDAAPATVRSRQAANRRAPLRHDVRDAVLSGHLDGFEAPDDDERPVRLSADDALSPFIVEKVRRAISTAG